MRGAGSGCCGDESRPSLRLLGALHPGRAVLPAAEMEGLGVLLTADRPGGGAAEEMRLNPSSPFSTGENRWGAGRSVCKEEGSGAAPSAMSPGGLGLLYLRAILVWKGEKTPR